MKTSYLQRTEVSFDEPTRIIPSDTSHEHYQRVEEWTQKSTSAPPSNRKRSAKDQESRDLEAKSQLIAEAVQLLDSRDKQTRSNDNSRNDPFDIDSDEDEGETQDESQYYPIGNRFRNSKLSARNYVKHFEFKMKRKKARQEAISNTYPSIRSRKDLLKGISLMHSLGDPSSAIPVVEPASWRFKASKSVKFEVKPGSHQNLSRKPSNEGSENGEKWEMKQENDRDWWKWKLKQRFLQNDELLHKLASQRKKLESSIIRGETHRINRNLIFNNKKAPTTTSTIQQEQPPQMLPAGRNSSWHVSVEIPSHMAISMSGKHSTPSKVKTSNPTTKVRDPIQNFYTPSKQLVTAITNPSAMDGLAKDPETSANQKLKVLKKDPYLSKLLAGTKMFRPEMMLDGNQQMSQEYKSASGVENTRRKLSLESLSDTDDEITASKFFNPDVKVLYERLSEMEVMNSRNLGEKGRLLEGGFLNSREPSDGFLNLPILLETGRFNRYNKLPSMKLLTTTNNNASKQQTKKSEKSYTRPQSKSKRSNLVSTKLVSTPIVGGGSAGLPSTEVNANTANQQGKLEDLPTTEWAKKVMQKVKKQDNSTKTEDGGYLEETKKKSDEFKDILTVQQNKYKVPVDQETNLLYHEILMSKWKKDKHGKEKENEGGGKNIKHAGNSNRKRVEHGHDSKKITDGDWSRPRGLDIWLENIREKAKRDRLISPLPDYGEALKGVPPLTS